MILDSRDNERNDIYNKTTSLVFTWEQVLNSNLQ
jgi:hypothetical protein